MSSWSENNVALNPAQEDVLAVLGASKDERPRFEKVLRHELRRALDDALEPFVGLLDARADTKPGDNMAFYLNLMSNCGPLLTLF